MDLESIRLGTSGLAAPGWEGTFYPAGVNPSQYLAYYAQHFDSLEVGSTFYEIPSRAVVHDWALQTPKGFLFSFRAPKIITHEKVLLDCGAEVTHFLDTMTKLEDKLGVILFQFPYFSKATFKRGAEFLNRLTSFMRMLPKDQRFAVETGNRSWLDARFADALREHNVALALTDHLWMPRPTELFDKFDPMTASFTYVRWMGERRGSSTEAKSWDRLTVDRTRELREWLEVFERIADRKIAIFAYADSHYAGHAPSTADTFKKMWQQARRQREGLTP
jgi:uncharacterized protein YecE (DUF72 family)